MNAEDLYKKLLNRKDIADIPISIIIRVSMVAFEEFLNLEKETRYVEGI